MLFCPEASQAFATWLERYPEVRLNPFPLQGAWTKYDIKPIALMTVLRNGADQAIWIDSDIVIAADFRPRLLPLSVDTVAVTEEALCSGHSDPNGLRTRLWGLPPGRTMPFTANSGVVRVTMAHMPLLEAWNALLQGETYRSAQALPWHQRGLHVMGDQEVLTALLGSRDFAEFPIRFLLRGRDVIQFFGSSGYTVAERLRHMLHGLPPFIHSQGFRPWWPREAPAPGFSGRFAAAYNERSPYIAAARRYAPALENPTWLMSRGTGARFLARLGRGGVPLSGFPLAVVADGVRLAKRMLRRGPRKAAQPSGEAAGGQT